MLLQKLIGHFITITKHRALVCHYCFKCGQYKRGILHDLSKYSPVEFFSGVKYYQGTSSPIDAEKAEKGYSYAWLHHRGHNPHHWEYWVDNVGTRKNTPIKMPYPYMIEMVCDWIGSGKTYLKSKWSQSSPYDFYMTVRNTRIIHPRTEKVVIFLLEDIRDNGLQHFCDMVKHPKNYKMLKNYIENDN